MNIAVASGKGGTGKTTVATNLVQAAAASEKRVVYIDCDVEEPNGHIFLKPEIDVSAPAVMQYPVIDEEACISCGKCAEICQYKAIVMIAEKPLVFPEMCHDCGGCFLVCPAEAVTLTDRSIGVVEQGHADAVDFVHGRLDIGQVMSPPLIRAVKRHKPDDDTIVVVDSPPGTSCPVIESVRGADFAVLVTEPTPFGLHDLTLAVEMLEELDIPYGVFINRADIGTDETRLYCEKRCIPVLAMLPDDRRIAEAYSRGEIIYGSIPKYETVFNTLLLDITKRVNRQ